MEPHAPQSDTMGQEPSRGNGVRLIAGAVVFAAVIIGGVIFFTTREPSKCDEGNRRLLTVVRQMRFIAEGDPSDIDVDEVRELQSETRRIVAEMPSDCEVDEEVAEEIAKTVISDP